MQQKQDDARQINRQTETETSSQIPLPSSPPLLSSVVFGTRPLIDTEINEPFPSVS